MIPIELVTPLHYRTQTTTQPSTGPRETLNSDGMSVGSAIFEFQAAAKTLFAHSTLLGRFSTILRKRGKIPPSLLIRVGRIFLGSLKFLSSRWERRLYQVALDHESLHRSNEPTPFCRVQVDGRASRYQRLLCRLVGHPIYELAEERFSSAAEVLVVTKPRRI